MGLIQRRNWIFVQYSVIELLTGYFEILLDPFLISFRCLGLAVYLWAGVSWRERYLHWIVSLLLRIMLLDVMRCHYIVHLTENFESWVFLHLSSQIMFWRIRLLFLGILVHYNHAFGRHVGILIHSSLLRANLWVSTLVCRIFSSFCSLVDHTWCPGWLITSRLLMVSNLAARQLSVGRRLNILVWGHYWLKIHHILFHVGLILRLVHHTCIVFSPFGQVGITYTKVTHVLCRTCLKTFNCALQRLASLLNSRFTIGFHQRW